MARKSLSDELGISGYSNRQKAQKFKQLSDDIAYLKPDDDDGSQALKSQYAGFAQHHSQLADEDDVESTRQQAANQVADSTRLAETSRQAMFNAEREFASQQSNLKANSGADLRSENISSVVAGGSADVADSDLPSSVKKKKGASVSSTLGINL